MLDELRAAVCKANRDLVEHKLVILTWGNVSGFDPASGLVAIKPSGVPYEKLTPEQMVIVDLDGKVVEGKLRPSSDTPTHVLLYRHFKGICGITHTHSLHATMFAQARREIPCLGTTHADHFFGSVPVTRALSAKEVDEAYEHNTGLVIIDRFKELDPLAMTAVLVGGHAPFAWGKSPADSLHNAIALEAVAQMAMGTFTLTPHPTPLEDYVLNKHHERKHGKNAYYGQAGKA